MALSKKWNGGTQTLQVDSKLQSPNLIPPYYGPEVCDRGGTEPKFSRLNPAQVFSDKAH